ncbi:MAG: hypothetical protein A2Y77_16220 [Planctomycetes bacterium RBG_13_62_9]|nr:MAG: hypothetical protein A2Y77_16220 [Planctomycetes bacterium RBG_13_62_9]
MERRKPLTLAVILCTLTLTICPSALARTIYVDDDAPRGGDGSSWQNAYKYLQDALADARLGERPVEVRVAQGLDTPDQAAGRKPEIWTAFYGLFDGLVLAGGYAGLGMPDPNVRNVNDYPTILSGVGREVMRVTDANVTVDGLTITGGSYSFIVRGGGDTWGGAGMCLSGVNARIANCTFVNNRAATGWGGAIFVGPRCHVEIADCTFRNNYARGWGGALFNNGGNVDLWRCVFTENLAESAGGAIGTMGGRVSSAFCEFIGNCGAWRGFGRDGCGGAAAGDDLGMLEFENSLLVANVAGVSGGAIHGANMSLVNCTLVGNRAPKNAATCAYTPGPAELLNCIIWRNENVPPWDVKMLDSNSGECSYCCLDSNAIVSRVVGNIDADPVFARPGYWDPNNTPDDPSDDFWVDGDYHLKSQAGRWDPNSQSWVIDDVTSPCIDAGDPNSPIGEEPQPNGGRINMGAYGGTAEASKSYFGKPPCEAHFAGDINGDCAVDFEDLAILSRHWLKGHQSPPPPKQTSPR